VAIVSLELVRLQAQARDKHDAIRQAGELLVRAGRVEPAYVDGMLAREQTMSTYLGDGISIPHGQREDLALVRRAGISVLQLPQGVEWEPGETAYLVFGIAATADEHVGVLANLAELFESPETIEQLIRTTDPILIVERLNRARQDIT